MKRRIFVFGMDGATFDVMEPMMARGELPHLSALMQRGSHGPLMSCTPDLSPPAWTSFMTGKHPGKHGILDFFTNAPRSYEIILLNASHRRGQPVWNLLSQVDKRVCVLNVPCTFPPDRVNGVMISGLDTPDIDSPFIHPPAFRQELFDKVGDYLLEKPERNLPDNALKHYLSEIRAVNDNRFNVTRYLLKKEEWDLFVIVFETTDRMQHAFWRFRDPRHPGYSVAGNRKFGTVVEDAYRELDSQIGALLPLLPEGSTVLIMSDHGFGPLYKGARVAFWLERQDILAYERQNGREPPPGMLLKQQIKNMLPKSLKRGLRKLLPLPPVDLQDEMPKLDNLDFARTRAFPMGAGGHLVINVRGRQPQGIVEPGAEYEALRDELIRRILEWRDPENGQAVVIRAQRREEVYDTFQENTPDIILTWQPGYFSIGEGEMAQLGIRADKESLFSPHRWSGNHLPNGIFILAGPDVKAGQRLMDAQITDIAPTIMALMEQGVPDDMDGKVLTAALEEEFLAAHPPVRVAPSAVADELKPSYSDEDQKKVAERLRGLGYLA